MATHMESMSQETRGEGGDLYPIRTGYLLSARHDKVMQVLPSARTRQDPLEISWHFDGTLTRKLKSVGSSWLLASSLGWFDGYCRQYYRDQPDQVMKFRHTSSS